MIVYIVKGHTGQYDNYSFSIWNVDSFLNKDEAEYLVRRAEEEAKRLNLQYSLDRELKEHVYYEDYPSKYDNKFTVSSYDPTYYIVEELEVQE